MRSPLRAAAFAVTLVLAHPAPAAVLAAGEPPKGAPAYLAMDLVDAPMTETRGVLKKGEVIAQHVLRAQDGIVLEAEAATRRKRQPAGLALAKVVYGPPANLLSGRGLGIAWCDVRGVGVFSMGQLDCLADSDSDGRLDQQLVGWIGSQSFFAFFVQKVGPPEPLATPVPYRSARPEERPATRIGYRLCANGGAASPRRFAAVVREGTDQGWSSPSIVDCRFGVWPDAADHSRLTIDAVELRLGPGDPPSFEVTAGPKAGPISLISPGGSLERAVAEKTLLGGVEAAVTSHARSPLRPVGPAKPVEGEVRRGQPILSVPARHAITGRLRNRVKALGLFKVGTTPLAPGQPVFGMRAMNGASYWCAPRQDASEGSERWRAVCLPAAGGMARWIEAKPGLFPELGTMISGQTSGADTPSVAEEPLEFGQPLTLEYRYGWANAKMTQIELFVRTQDGDSRAGMLMLRRSPDGSSELPILGGRLRITPAADAKSAVIAVADPLKADGPLPF